MITKDMAVCELVCMLTVAITVAVLISRVLIICTLSKIKQVRFSYMQKLINYDVLLDKIKIVIYNISNILIILISDIFFSITPVIYGIAHKSIGVLLTWLGLQICFIIEAKLICFILSKSDDMVDKAIEEQLKIYKHKTNEKVSLEKIIEDDGIDTVYTFSTPCWFSTVRQLSRIDIGKEIKGSTINWLTQKSKFIDRIEKGDTKYEYILSKNRKEILLLEVIDS